MTPVNEPGAAEDSGVKMPVLFRTTSSHEYICILEPIFYLLTDTNRFSFTLDGVSNSADFTLSVNGSASDC